MNEIRNTTWSDINLMYDVRNTHQYNNNNAFKFTLKMNIKTWPRNKFNVPADFLLVLIQLNVLDVGNLNTRLRILNFIYSGPEPNKRNMLHS